MTRTPRQVEFLTGRFLPLAVHEAGGHGTDGEDLRRLLGNSSAPLNKDTELRAWRLEAAAIEAERRSDPRYLTEPTPWTAAEGEMMTYWRRSREQHNPQIYEKYLDSLGYDHLPNVSRDPDATRRKYGADVALVQRHCRETYDAGCGRAVDELISLIDPNSPDYDRLSRLRKAVDAHPADDALRGALMKELFQRAVVDYRLDPKGIAVVSSYYQSENKRVSALEGAVDPRSLTDRFRSWRLP